MPSAAFVAKLIADEESDEQRIRQRHGVHAVEAGHARRIQVPRPVRDPDLVRVLRDLLNQPTNQPTELLVSSDLVVT